MISRSTKQQSLLSHLQEVTADDLQSAVGQLNLNDADPPKSVQLTLRRAKDYPALGEIIKTLQDVGAVEKDLRSPALQKVMGMKLIFEALIVVAEKKASH